MALVEWDPTFLVHTNIQHFFSLMKFCQEKNIKIQKFKSEVIFWRVSIARREKI
jgi:hypothetical protein